MISLRANRLLQKHYEALSPRLYRLAWSWTHDRDSAQDLVQETWAKAFERSRQLQDEARLQAWLSRIMVNLYRDQLRAAREHLDIGGLELAHDQDTDSQAGKQDEIERVRRAVARLPHDQRMVLTLVDLMELSYAQVSETLDVPIGTVMSRLSRSRNRLKQLLQEDAAPARIRRIRRIK